MNITSSFVFAVFHTSISTRGFVVVLEPDYTLFILQYSHEYQNKRWEQTDSRFLGFRGGLSGL
jgi:hypothetical protein